MECLWCRQRFSGRKRRYCTNLCFNEHRKHKTLEPWLNGANAGSELNKAYRAYLLEQAENKCTECGWAEVNPYSGLITLTIDHIDGDAQNNRINNLKVLCYNCHTLTPTFNQLNRGKGTRKNAPGTRRANTVL